MRKPTKRTAVVDDAILAPVESRIASRGGALVFISHDSRDADLAEAFSNLLTDVSAGMLKSFRASDKKGTMGIAFGAEWYSAIMSQIDKSTDVVALLTPQSIARPWILYEAGVAKGKLETTVLGVALGTSLENLSNGPFGQFQNCGDDEDSLTKLVMQLLERNPDAAPREEAVRMQVRIFREKTAEITAARGANVEKAGSKDDDSNVAKLFEEVKAMVRELPDRVDDRFRSVSRSRSGMSKRRIHPGMLEELLFRFERDEENGAVVLLFVISMYRDDLPWIYEPGMELYRALVSDQRAVTGARRRFLSILKISDHPMFYEFGRGSEDDAFMLMMELPRLIDRILDRKSIPRPRTTHRKPSEGGANAPDDSR